MLHICPAEIALVMLAMAWLRRWWAQRGRQDVFTHRTAGWRYNDERGILEWFEE